ncbi:MAG: peptide deformylase [Deltaproteobacteria bacterium]|nr:peptide deformylase [Deltaproteobacteria bacterium]
MPMLNILTYPDNFLRQPAKPVEDIDGTTQKMIADMSYTMYGSKGVGLAAIQVGFDKSIILYDVLQSEEKRSLQVLINPRIIESNGRIISEKEGCLSVPDLRANVKRAKSILVEAFDKDGNPKRIDAEGYLAIVLQHEIDHLNGILFIDHISTLKRELYKRHIKKQLRK